MTGNDTRPIIIKKKKKGGGDGHHGGAWKVAYADFVTAMMAFFMLMWLLNATTEQQRKGIADYFSPTLPISRVSGGGDGVFGGEDIFSQDTLTESGAGPQQGGGPEDEAADPEALAAARAAEAASLAEIEQALMGLGGESMLAEQALRHVVTRLTDEGLVIEIFALPGIPIFEDDTAEALPLTRDLVEMIARVSSIISNPIAVASHVNARPIVLAGSPTWDITSARATAVREMLETGGLDPARVLRVTGHADRSPVTDDPLDIRNDRFEITILRQLP